MAEHGMEAKILAGGHSLLPAMKLRLNQPGVLIDIGRIADTGLRDGHGGPAAQSRAGSERYSERYRSWCLGPYDRPGDRDLQNGQGQVAGQGTAAQGGWAGAGLPWKWTMGRTVSLCWV